MHKKLQRPLAAWLLVSHTLVSCSKNPMADIVPQENYQKQTDTQPPVFQTNNYASTASRQTPTDSYTESSNRVDSPMPLADFTHDQQRIAIADDRVLELQTLPQFIESIHTTEQKLQPTSELQITYQEEPKSLATINDPTTPIPTPEPKSIPIQDLADPNLFSYPTTKANNTYNGSFPTAPSHAPSIAKDQPKQRSTQQRNIRHANQLQQEQALRQSQQAARAKRNKQAAERPTRPTPINKDIRPTFTTCQGHQIQFTDNTCSQAHIDLNLPYPFKKSLQVAVKKQDTTLQLGGLLRHPIAWQLRNFHLYLPENDPAGKGVLYIGENLGGLLGGMRKGGNEERGECGHTRQTCTNPGQPGHVGYRPPQQNMVSTLNALMTTLAELPKPMSQEERYRIATREAEMKAEMRRREWERQREDKIREIDREIERIQRQMRREEEQMREEYERRVREEETRREQARERLEAEITTYVKTTMQKVEKIYGLLETKHNLLKNNCKKQLDSLIRLAQQYEAVNQYPALQDPIIKEMLSLRDEMIILRNKLNHQYQASAIIYYSPRDVYFGPTSFNFLRDYQAGATQQLQILTNSIKQAELNLEAINYLLPKGPVVPIPTTKAITEDYLKGEEINARKFYQDYIGFKYEQLNKNYKLVMSQYDKKTIATETLLNHSLKQKHSLKEQAAAIESLHNKLEKLFKNLTSQYIETHDLYYGPLAIKLFEDRLNPEQKVNQSSDFDMLKAYPAYEKQIVTIIAKYSNQKSKQNLPSIDTQLHRLEKAIRGIDGQLGTLRPLLPPARSATEIIQERIEREKEKARTAERAKQDKLEAKASLAKLIEMIAIIKNDPPLDAVNLEKLFDNLTISPEQQAQQKRGEVLTKRVKPEPNQQEKEPMKVSYQGMQFIADHEGLVPQVRPDPVGLPTIGYGHQILPGEIWDPKKVLDKEKAWDLLEKDVEDRAAQYVNRYVIPSLLQHEFDALSSLVFNIGCGTFKKSTLLKYVNQQVYKNDQEGRNKIRQGFTMYNKAKKTNLTGLIDRRAHEADLFLDGIYWKK